MEASISQNNIAVFNQISIEIIKEQALIIGPLAWTEARKVLGLQIISQKPGEVMVDANDPKGVIDRLVAQYERLFGKLSHDICKEAAHDLIATLPENEIPSSLM